ncbi:MAG: hypothetical protein KGD68_11835 [Candidatus Lokiarchaeota archaeon]|nr:hypothetical protein [Candidatus Lokiarchaeota archaeon]
MGLEASKRKEHEPIIIEIVEYENIDVILSKVIIPFSEVIGTSTVPDIYVGHEKIPFEKRHSLYQTIMRQEFMDAMKALKSEEK